MECKGIPDIKTKAVHNGFNFFRFPDLMDYLLSMRRASEVGGFRLGVVVEAGWLNKGNWHLTNADTKYSAAEKGRQTGRNHETGRKIVEMCDHYRILTEEVRPLRKLWLGKDRKITADEFNRITGYSGRSSQDARDAGLIAWVYAGFPVKIY